MLRKPQLAGTTEVRVRLSREALEVPGLIMQNDLGGALIGLPRHHTRSGRDLFNAESIFMRTSHSIEGARRHFTVAPMVLSHTNYRATSHVGSHPVTRTAAMILPSWGHYGNLSE